MNVEDRDAAQTGIQREMQAKQSPVKYTSCQLFNGQKEVVIVHAEGQYRLRITRHDKLILTK